LLIIKTIQTKMERVRTQKIRFVKYTRSYFINKRKQKELCRLNKCSYCRKDLRKYVCKCKDEYINKLYLQSLVKAHNLGLFNENEPGSPKSGPSLKYFGSDRDSMSNPMISGLRCSEWKSIPLGQGATK
jgi:hypothetical protein